MNAWSDAWIAVSLARFVIGCARQPPLPLPPLRRLIMKEKPRSLASATTSPLAKTGELACCRLTGKEWERILLLLLLPSETQVTGPAWEKGGEQSFGDGAGFFSEKGTRNETGKKAMLWLAVLQEKKRWCGVIEYTLQTRDTSHEPRGALILARFIIVCASQELFFIYCFCPRFQSPK